MRLAEAFICVMWIIYDLFVGAYAGIITEFIILTSSIIGMYRYDIKKKKIEN